MNIATTQVTVAHLPTDGAILVLGTHAASYAREAALRVAEREHWGYLEAIADQLDQLPTRLWARLEDSDGRSAPDGLLIAYVSRETADAMPALRWNK